MLRMQVNGRLNGGAVGHAGSAGLDVGSLVSRWMLVALMVASPVALAQEFGSGQLQVAGMRLIVSPEAQTVPFDTPTVVETALDGLDPDAALPLDLRALADFSGPEIDGVLTLETVPGQPFRIPRLRREGEYQLDNIRLADGGQLLAYATPRSATVRVTQILVTRVSSRALTLDEIRGYGIVIGDDSFQALNFTFGFGVNGGEVSFDVPIVVDYASGTAAVIGGGRRGRDWLPPTPRFRPPSIVPFTFEIRRETSAEVPSGGCPPSAIALCLGGFKSPPLVGVLAFPTDVALLHQFFSAVMMVQNGAPDGDVLTVRDLTARIQLPPGLRQAETNPPTPLGVPVPVRVPGPDGELGTADDLTFLVAQATGEAGFLVEGLREGTHVVDFTLDGVLDGLPTGPQRIEGSSRGAVVVRDPHLQVTINHPDVVRDGEPYPLRFTVSNIGPAPVNLVSLTLPVSGVSGADVVGARSRTIATLSPGDSELVTFDMVARRTGRVVASTVKSGSSIAPQFEFSVGVSNDIPLSPDALILPKSTEVLPATIVEPAISLLGLGHSLATASESDLAPHLPRVTSDQVSARVYRLAQAGRHRALGEPLFDTAAILAAEMAGARDGFEPWDALRRGSIHGETLAAGFAAIFDQEAQATSPAALFDRLVSTTGFLPPRHLVLVDGPGATLQLTEAAGTGRLVGFGAGAERTLPMAELYPLTGALLASVEAPSAAGYRLQVGGTGSLDVHLLVPAADGALEVARWSGIALATDDVATVDFALGATVPQLLIDRFSDGLIDQTVAPTIETLDRLPFAATLAVQNIEVDASGHVVDVLFSRDVDPASLDPQDPSHFLLPGRVSNGGFVQRGLYGTDQNPDATIAAMSNFRMVRVVFDNPLDPLAANLLTVQDVIGADGTTASPQILPVVINASTVGAPVEGIIIGPDGAPVAFAEVRLFEYDESFLSGCVSHRTAAVRADAEGRFRFDFVRGETCDQRNRFRLEALDPIAPWRGGVTGRVRTVGETVTLNVVMLGRGRIEGQVRFDDGTVPEGIDVVAYNSVFQDGRRATVTPDGRYYVDDVVVGAVSLSAHDADGNFVFATVELPLAGAIVNQDLIVPRASPVPTGQVRGTVVELDGGALVADAFVALYVDARLIGVRLSEADGRFDFGVVPAGVVEIEAFHPDTHETGGQLFFEVAPDEIRDVTIVLRDDRGAVEGHVYRQALDGTLTPIANAVVWVHLQGANTVTDALGAYRLDGVLAGTVQVRGADPVTGVGLSGAVTVTADGTATRDLILVESGPAGGITGQVLGFDGLPVAGAVVHIGNGHPNPLNWHHRATTDAQGQFVLTDIGPGTHPVHAVAGSQGGIALATVRFPGDTPNVTVRFKRGEIRLQTYVRDLDGVLVGVTSQVQLRKTIVRFELVGLAGFPTGHQTDAQGLVTFPNSLVGEYELFVSNPFHGEKHIRGVLVEDGDIVEHEVIFEPAGSVRGVVLGHDGVTPVAGAAVALDHPQLGAYDVTSDAAGAFAFELVPPGCFSVRATVDGLIYRTASISGCLSRPGEILEGVELVLPRQGSVTGRVEDSNSVPVPGAVVALREYAYPRRMLEANADLEGRFAFDNVFVGEIGLRAQAPTLGGLGGRVSTAITAEGEVVDVLIMLEDTGELTGQVQSPVDGGPVPFAEITLRSSGGFTDALNADDEGRYRFRLLPLGAYEVRAFEAASGRFGRNAEPIITANGEVVESDVVLQARGEVEGHVTEPEQGGPVPAATVKLTSATPFFTLRTYSSSDVDGYFLFGGIPEGTFRLTTQEPDSRRRASGAGEILTEDERVTVDLVFERYGTVSGSVLNPPGTDPGLFPNVNTRAIKRSGGTLVLGATLDNPYLFDGLLPNEPFEIVAEEIGGQHRGIAKGRLSAEGDAMTLDVAMLALGSVRVSVVDSFGNPVSGVDVTFVAQSLLGGGVRYDATGTDHEVVFTDVPAGVVSVSVKHPVTGLRGSASASLTLEGELVLLTVPLQDTGFVRGRVLLADGVTPAIETLAALQQGSRFLYSVIAADGGFAFEGVRLGSYELILQESFGSGQYQAPGSIDVNGEVDDFGDLVLDEHDPELVSITPVSGTRDLPLDTVVVLTFDEPIDTARFVTNSSAFIRVLGAYGGHSTQPSWSADGTTLTLTPIGPLASGTIYELVVERSIYDLAGRQLPSATRATFYTADVIPPAVIDVVPADGAVEVPIDSPALITFSEPIELFSLSGTALQLDDLTTGVGVSTTFQLRPGEREVILTPVGGLIADRQYRVTIQGVLDLAGNVQAAPTVITFWSPDETPPTVAWTIPADGDSFVAGDLMTLAVQASDNREVARVEFTVDGGVLVDEAAPFEVTVPAPVVATAGSVVITATAIDAFDNTASADRSIVVTPRVNAAAPAIRTPCLYQGDRVLPGVALAVPVTITDDEAVERYSFWVDDVLIEEVRFGAEPSTTHDFNWTPPDGAAPGMSFVLRIDARDYAGNTATHGITVKVPAEPLLSGDQILDAGWNGQALALVDGVFTVDGPLAFAELSLLPGATLRPMAATALDVAATTTLRVQCGATIDASGEGFAGGVAGSPTGQAPPWALPSASDAGGSHGGLGLVWDGAGPAGDVFDSVYRPQMAGGGGALGATTSSGPGNAGGGVVRLVADTVVVAGDVIARGGEGASFAAAAGGGGAIWIDATTLRGGGLVDASGGDKGHCSAGSGSPEGAGGGGRVALWADLIEDFDPVVQAWARGGMLSSCFGDVNGYGGAGTVFVRTAAMAYGELHLDGGAFDPAARPVVATPLPELGAGDITTVAVTGQDAWITGTTPFLPRWDGAWMTLRDAVGAALGTFPVASVDTAGRALLLDAAASAPNAAAFAGEYRFDRLRFGDDVGLELTSPLGGALVELNGDGRLSGTIATDNATISSGAIVRPLAGLPLRFDITDTLRVEAGGLIDASGLGYPGGVIGASAGGVPPWVGAPGINAGGSHGGAGILWDHYLNDPPGPPGEVYDSVYWPTLAGGGGAQRSEVAGQEGRPGGGVLILEAGTVVLDGNIAARGESDPTPPTAKAGAGAGGSVAIRANVLQGTGSIDVSGGDVVKGPCPYSGSTSSAGAGGGGRVALWVTTTSSFDAATQVVAHGGATRCAGADQDWAAPGTIYVFGPDAVSGTLYVDNGGDQRPAEGTALPTLGTGSVVSSADDGSDAWLSAANTLHPRWVGAWMQLLDSAGASLGTYRVGTVDDLGRARLVGAAGLVGAASFRGVYRFDQIEVGAGASVSNVDPVESSDLVFDGAATVSNPISAGNMTLHAGAVVTVEAPGGQINISGVLLIEAGAVLDASGQGYPGGTQSAPAGGAPSWVGASGINAGGSHGGAGILWDHDLIDPPGPPGEVFDSVYWPTLAGGGGAQRRDGASQPGQPGGGVLTIEAGTMVIDGVLLARGTSDLTAYAAAGAGGGVAIRANVLQGTGSIDVSGGDFVKGPCPYFGSTSAAGGGGGGRVALWVTTTLDFDAATQVVAHGGATSCAGTDQDWAAPGTIYVFGPAATSGTLYIDNGGDQRPAAATALPTLGTGSVVSLADEGADAWLTAASTLHPRWIGAWMQLLDSAGASLGTVRVATIDEQGRARLTGAAGLAGAASFAGHYRFDAIVAGHGGGIEPNDPLQSTTLTFEGTTSLGGIKEGLAAGDLTLRAGAFVQLTGAHSRLEVSGTLTVESGAVLDATGSGYPGGDFPLLEGGAPVGVAGATDRSGGSHGGVSNYPTIGEVYDSVYQPTRAGGGGGALNGTGMAGGGALVIEAGEVILDGELRARGASKDAAASGGGTNGAGAGGTIAIAAQRLSGLGLIDVSGGVWGSQTNNTTSKGGGGGRVALWVADLTAFDIVTQTHVDGGTRDTPNGITDGYAGPGTVFTFDQSAVHGDLWLHQHQRDAEPLPGTPLPAAGRGTLASVVLDATNPLDVWVAADVTDPLFDLGLEGMQLRVAGVDYPVIGQSADRTQLLLGGAAAQVAVGDDYVGVYRFDTVHIDGGATLVLGDVDDVGLYDVADGAVIRLIEVESPVIESVTPVAGTVLLQGWTIQAGAVVSDNDAVADVTFAFAGQSVVDATAPYGAALIAPSVLVATDFDLLVTALDAQGNSAALVRTLRVEPGDPPVILDLQPAAGTVYSAGQPIVVSANVTDDDVVAQVSLTFDGQTLVDSADPWTWTVVAPAVTVSTAMTLVLDAVDAQGNTASASQTIQVEPQSTAAPPTLVVESCPADGDWVTPGTDSSFAFAVADEGGVESWSVIIDGVLIDSAVGLVGLNEIAVTVPWTVPASAVLGQAFVIQIVAANYGGGVATETLTLTVPPAGYMTGGTLDATFNGQALVLGSGTYTVTEALQPASLHVLQGATVVSATGVIDIETSSLTLVCGATIDLDGAGYWGGATSGASGEAPAWVNASGSNAGGSHGGSGAKGGRPGLAGDVYGSVYLPAMAGGGGGAYNGSNSGGAGGGALVVSATQVVLDGTIFVRGESRDATASPPQYYDGGGAGGSVLISTSSLSGTGTINVSGGSYTAHSTSSSASGGGGGGRVGLWVDQTLDFDVDSGVTAFGGTSTRLGSPLKDQAAPGTVLIAGPSATYGRLIVDAGADPGAEVVSTALPNLGNEAISVFAPVGADAWITSAGGALWPRWLGTTVAVFDAAGTELGAFSVVDLSEDGRILVAGAGTLTGATTFEGRYRFDGVTIRQGARLDAADSLDLGDVVVTGEVSLPSTMVASSLTVQADSVLRATHGTLAFDVAGAVTIETGAVIDVDGAGYLGGATSGASGEAPAWVTASGSNAGGSHGGSGAKGGRSGLAGDVYDSVFLPSLAGGGGGAYNGNDSGGVGGGAVMIFAGEVVLDGTIFARGESRDATASPPRYYDGGGAGGSVLISTSVLRGTGTINVSGGSYIAHSTSSSASGGGGGGRVGLWVGQTLDFDVDASVIAFGGTSTRLGSPLHPQASPGTIVIAGPGATHGRLIVDGGPNTGSNLATTVLPSLGTASVALLEAAGDDAWITSASGALPPRWLGTTVAVFDAAGVELGAFPVADLSDDGRILLVGAGVLSEAETVEGRYRFDEVALRNGGGLDATDELDLGNVVAEGEVSLPSPVVAASLTVQAGAVLRGTHGILALDVSGVVTIEMGATVDLTGAGFLGGATSGASGEAPAWVTASGSNAGGSHGGSGAKGGRSGLAGDVFDSVFLPSLAGGGGGAYNGNDTGGAGGGALTIAASEVVLDGLILARGASRDATAIPPRYYDGGGAGGSVLIFTSVLRGTGTIDVSGGSYIAHSTSSLASGGGGGGRVGLWVGQTLDFDVDASVIAFGGTSTRLGSPLHPQASPGTIVIAGPGATHGRLIVDGGPNTGPDLATTLLPGLGTDVISAFEAVGDDAWITSGTGALQPRWLGTAVAVFDASGIELGAFAVVDLSDDGRLLLAGAGALSGAATYEGRYRFDGVTLRNGAQLDATDALDLGNVVAAGEVALPSPVVASSLTVQPNGVLHATHGTLALDVAGVVTIEATAMIDLDGGGYFGGSSSGQPGAAPASVGASGSNAGGSHGGSGTKGGRTGVPGDVFDSVYLPSHAGGGGGAYNGSDSGGAGGGLLTIVAAEVVIHGVIRARGESRDATASPPRYYDGGGAGGTVLISAPVLRGTGTIDVSGGSYIAHSTSSTASGGGGGGRVAIWVNQTLTFDVESSVLAVGGTSLRLGASLHPQAAPGTIFVAGPSAADGDLLVDAGPNNGLDPIPDTVLPAIGSGTVGVVETSLDNPADAWVEPTDALALFDLGATGMWLRVAGIDYRVLDEATDRRRLLLAGGSGVVVVGDAYQGVYRFDTVIVRRGATVVIPDVAEVTTFDVDPDSSAQAQALLVPPDWLDWARPPSDPDGDGVPPERWADGLARWWPRPPVRVCRAPEVPAPLVERTVAIRRPPTPKDPNGGGSASTARVAKARLR